MSLKRSDIKATFPDATPEQIQLLIEKHTETVEALQQQIETFKESASQSETLQKKLNELEAKHSADLEIANKAFEDYKNEVSNKETVSKKQELYRAELKAAKISDAAIEKAVKIADYSLIELEGDKLKNTKSIQESIMAEWGDFAVTTEVLGANTANPPQNLSSPVLTKEDINKMTAKQINENWEKVSEVLKNKT